MIIYRVSGDYNKGIKEFEIERVNDNGTFDYRHKGAPWDGEIFRKHFVPLDGYNQPYYFLTLKEAKQHLVNSINKKIEEYSECIRKAKITIEFIDLIK